MNEKSTPHSHAPTRRATEGWAFLAESIRNHRTVGSIAPSSKSLADLLAAPLRERAPRISNVLEVGAGTGSVTRVLLPRMSRGSCLDIVEANAHFAAHLRRLVRGYPHLQEQQEHVRVHNVCVEQLATDRRYDVIVSGLPFSNFSPRQVDEIMGHYFHLLRPGGTLTYFSYRGSRFVRTFLTSRPEASRQRDVKDLLNRYHHRYATGRWTVWGNLPPAQVWQLRRPLETVEASGVLTAQPDIAR
ncbi:class I SAM-dependent methyltransferase [Streptomyces mooreae]|uniref:class I SAM-dependent methyltransferase n=1 Tax=Streptomyces mooreae TaxID=3075523 RepID=UPI002889B98C|nr:methyltransferase [Streptomyces sp. DSM 41527]